MMTVIILTVLKTNYCHLQQRIMILIYLFSGMLYSNAINR